MISLHWAAEAACWAAVGVAAGMIIRPFINGLKIGGRRW